MFENLEIFQLAGGLARHAAARQGAIARNVANADTPGFRALDIKSFAETFQSQNGNAVMRSTRSGHINELGNRMASVRQFQTDDPVSPNGNSVSLETEMVKASEVRHQHEMALSIYSKSMDILRASIGSR